MYTSSQYSVKSFPGKFELLPLIRDYPERYPYFLESTALSTDESSKTARFDILMAFPQQQLCKTAEGQVLLDGEIVEEKEFLKMLNRLFAAERTAENLPLPFMSGWFLYLGYELANEIEPSLAAQIETQHLPIAFAVRIPAAIVFDHAANTTYVIAEKMHAGYLESMISDLEQLQAHRYYAESTFGEVSEEPPGLYLASVKKVLRYIKEGDVFQVNLSRRWHLPVQHTVDPVTIYSRLRKTNPAPFAAYAHIGDAAILSSSPERLVQVHTGRVETRPIAGTRPRSHDMMSDKQLKAELLSNVKERAEHVMLIDLERNDLGRICKPGTISVDEMMVIESYAHVHHIVSNISGQLSDNIGPGDIIAAVFPGGTITGCPKVRCMEIIQELEQSPRGAYTGSLGYLNRNGDMDLNILIRTIVVEPTAINVRAGAGLVADSIPEKELEETRSKAKGMLLALTG